MAFRIIGDTLEYEYRTIARFTVPSFDTWRNRAANLLEDMDPDVIEKEESKAIKDIEDEHRDEIAELQDKIEDLKDKIENLETKNATLERLLDAIEGGSTAAELTAAAHKERNDWRKIALDNRAAYLAAVAPKPRKRRTPQTGV